MTGKRTKRGVKESEGGVRAMTSLRPLHFKRGREAGAELFVTLNNRQSRHHRQRAVRCCRGLIGALANGGRTNAGLNLQVLGRMRDNDRLRNLISRGS